MANELLNNELQSLERKLGMLLQERQKLLHETALLKGENEELKKVVRQKDQHINDFQNQFKINKIVNTIGTGENNTTELKDKIDEYIKEIDKCIVHLTR